MVNHIQRNQDVIKSIPPMLYVFFIGAVADRYGKKIMIVTPLIGIEVVNSDDLSYFSITF